MASRRQPWPQPTKRSSSGKPRQTIPGQPLLVNLGRIRSSLRRSRTSELTSWAQQKTAKNWARGSRWQIIIWLLRSLTRMKIRRASNDRLFKNKSTRKWTKKSKICWAKANWKSTTKPWNSSIPKLSRITKRKKVWILIIPKRIARSIIVWNKMTQKS